MQKGNFFFFFIFFLKKYLIDFIRYNNLFTDLGGDNYNNRYVIVTQMSPQQRLEQQKNQKEKAMVT